MDETIGISITFKHGDGTVMNGSIDRKSVRPRFNSYFTGAPFSSYIRIIKTICEYT